MVVSTRPDHGILGSDMAREYMRKENLKPEKFQEALVAIEKHDDKEYKSAQKASNKPDVYTILTIADDLDAFGAIGVFRYLEIYALRKISSEGVKELILDNLEKRFNHFSIRTSNLPDFILRHEKRKELSVSILNSLSQADLKWVINHLNGLSSLDDFLKILEERKSSVLNEWIKEIQTEMQLPENKTQTN